MQEYWYLDGRGHGSEHNGVSDIRDGQHIGNMCIPQYIALSLALLKQRINLRQSRPRRSPRPFK